MKKKLPVLPNALLWFFLAIAIVTTIAAVVFQSTSTRVLYASQMGCALNSDVYNGGGTDDSAALQAALNLASSKGYKLIVDGPALISTNLVLPSNTKLEFLPGAGLFLKPGANTWVFGNAQNTNYASTNIVIEGGIINANGNFQTEYVTNGFRLNGAQGTHGAWFAGVDGLILRDLTIRSAKAYTFLFNDSRNVLVENCTSYYTNNCAVTNTLYGNDGLHLYCNISNFRARDFRAFGNQDDVIALMTDETDFTLPFKDPRWTTNSGTMSNIVIENVFVDNCKNTGKIQSYGSTNACVKRVQLRNIYGKASGQGLVTVLDANSDVILSDDFLIDGFDMEFGGSMDSSGGGNAIDLKLYADTVRISNVRVWDKAGNGAGTTGLIAIYNTATNILINGVVLEGSANSVANNDSGISIIAGPNGGTNQPYVSINNATVRSRYAFVDSSDANGPTTPNGIIRLSNIQYTPGTVLNAGGFTNFLAMPTNMPTSGQAITATGTAGETAWTTFGAPTITYTNFISGLRYVNGSRPISINAQVSLTAAQVNGASEMSVFVDATGGTTWSKTNLVTIGTTVTTIADGYIFQLSTFVPANASYILTNTSRGAGNTATTISSLQSPYLITY